MNLSLDCLCHEFQELTFELPTLSRGNNYTLIQLSQSNPRAIAYGILLNNMTTYTGGDKELRHGWRVRLRAVDGQPAR